MTEYYYNHKDLGVCLTFPGLVWLGYPENTLKSASLRESNSWPFVDHPQDGRKKLLPYEGLAPKKKEEISQRLRLRSGCKHADGEPCACGDIYNYTAIEPIQNMIAPDDKAAAFYTAYRFTGANGNPESLPTEKIRHYTTEAGILNMINRVQEDTIQIVKRELGFGNVAEFWNKVSEVIRIEKSRGNVGGKFPTSYERLIAHKNSLIKQYKAAGYQSLIHGNYGKPNASKVNAEECLNKLLSLIEDPRQMDDVLVCMVYNNWAVPAGYKTIDAATVRNYRLRHGDKVDAGRYGNMAYNEKRIRQVKGFRPSAPLLLVEHDDNNLDFLFQDGKYQFHRYVSIVVADGYNDLVLGKSYTPGDTPQQWMVEQAYIDAMYYIRSLTGGWHLPFEIKSDNWAKKSLEPFYNKVARRIPAGHGNKHRGYIEQLFGSTHWKRCQQLVSRGNWNANNITAKKLGVNPDMLAMSIKEKSRPMIGLEAEQQIENFFALVQKMPAFTRENMAAPSKEAQWLEKWNATHADDKRPLTDEEFLLRFGITHKPKHTDNMIITNRGVEPQICGAKYSYDLPEEWMYKKLIGAKVQIMYDAHDMSRVLVTNHDEIRFVAKTAQLSPRALHDTYTGSRTYLNAVLEDKKDQWGKVAESQESRKMVANGYPVAEGILKSGVFTKDIMKGAEQLLISGSAQAPVAGQGDSWDDTQDFIDDNYDLDKFYK